MKKSFLSKLTVFYVIGLITAFGIIVSSTIMIAGNGAADGLQGIINLLGLPLIIIILIIDRKLIRKFETPRVNKVQFIIVGILILLFLINWIRLQSQI